MACSLPRNIWSCSSWHPTEQHSWQRSAGRSFPMFSTSWTSFCPSPFTGHFICQSKHLSMLKEFSTKKKTLLKIYIWVYSYLKQQIKAGRTFLMFLKTISPFILHIYLNIGGLKIIFLVFGEGLHEANKLKTKLSGNIDMFGLFLCYCGHWYLCKPPPLKCFSLFTPDLVWRGHLATWQRTQE